MKYYSEDDVRALVCEVEALYLFAHSTPIKVRYCRDCPCFQANYWQQDPSVVRGWCKRLSYYETMDNEEPYYVYVNSNSFCNEDDIVDVY